MKSSKLFQFSLALFLGLLISTAGTAQRKINGTVLDETTNLPLGGATIAIENSKIYTITDSGGKFELEISGKQTVLIVSFVGHDTRNVVVGASETNVSVKLMQSSNNELSQVVVVGYGVQKKVNLTGAVSVVGNKMLENRPVSNAIQALQGAAPGLIVTRLNGQPGNEGWNINIRGISSLNGTKQSFNNR